MGQVGVVLLPLTLSFIVQFSLENVEWMAEIYSVVIEGQFSVPAGKLP